MGNVPTRGHRAVGGLRLRRAGRVVHAGDAVGDQRAGTGGDVLGPTFGVGVVAHRLRVRFAPRPLDEQSGGLPIRSPDDLAARAGPAVSRADAERVERGRADDALVQRVVRHDDRPVDGGRVEIVSGDGQRVHVDALAADPSRLRLGGVLGADRVDQDVAVTHAGHVVPARVQRGDREVVVRVDEAGEEHRPVEIDHLGIGMRAQDLAATDGGDARAVDDHHGGSGRPGLHGEDSASGERDGHQARTLAGRDFGPWRWPGRPSYGRRVATTTAVPKPIATLDVEAAIADVSRRLVDRFSGQLPPPVVESTVRSCAARWADVRVHEFVPLFVERRSIELLRGLIACS